MERCVACGQPLSVRQQVQLFIETDHCFGVKCSELGAKHDSDPLNLINI